MYIHLYKHTHILSLGALPKDYILYKLDHALRLTVYLLIVVTLKSLRSRDLPESK
jgi:hypothetical protein